MKGRLLVAVPTLLLVTAIAPVGQRVDAAAANQPPVPPSKSSVQLQAPHFLDFRRLPPSGAARGAASTHFQVKNQASYAAERQLADRRTTGRRLGVVNLSGGHASAGVAQQTPQLLTGFPVMDLSGQVGIYGADQAVQPPDTQLAAGPVDVAEADNSTLSVWTKAGALVGTADLNVFFGLPAGYHSSDPRILYDAESSRWILSGLAFTTTNDGRVYVAVSATSDPAGTWAIVLVWSQTGVIGDQPMTGVNTDKVVISWNDFGGAGGTIFMGQETWVLQKADLLAAVAPHAASFGPDTTRYRIVPAQSLSASGTEWLVYNNAACSGSPGLGCTTGSPTVGAVAITGTPSAGTVAWTEHDLGIQASSLPPTPRQPSGVAVTNDLDQRYLSAVSHGGSLWLSGTDACIPVGDNAARDCIRLVQITTGANPTVGHDIDAGVLGADAYYPAVTLNNIGDLFIAFSESSSSLFPGAYGVDSLAATPGVFDNPVTLAAGQASYVQTPSNRWGDYSGAATDPANPADVWLTAEYQASPVTAGNWGTATARVVIQPSISAVTPNSGTTAGGSPVTITGDHFQPGATVSFGATQASNIVVVSGTQITANTPSGVAGSVSVGVSNPDASNVSLASAYTYLAPAAYTAQTPTRLMDTRISGGALVAGGTRNLTVAGVGAVPSGATAVVLNVTVTDTTSYGYLTVYPAGATRPLASNLNWVPGETIPNLVTVQIGSGGAITFYNSVGSTDVVVDLQGYYATPVGSAGGMVALTPARITDTRTGSGQPNAGGTLGPGVTLNVQVTGAGGVPMNGAAAAVLNVTVTNTTMPSFLTVWPAGATRPLASNLNWSPGQTIPNRVIVPIGVGGQVSVFNNVGSVDVIVDVGGYFTDATAVGKLFIPQSPQRILDTRISGGTLASHGTLTLQVSGAAGVPSGASAAVINVTVTNTTGPSFLTVYPSTGSRPLASDLNWVAGDTIPNLVTATLGGTGAITVYNNAGSTDVIIDIAGWYG